MMRQFLILCSNLAVFLSIACTDFSGKNTDTEINVKDVPDMEILDTFKREYYEGSELLFIITATNVRQFQKKNIAYIYEVEVKTFSGSNVSARGKADMGVFGIRDNTIELRSNVLIKFSNNMRLYTDQLEVDRDSGRLFTTNKVRIIHPNGHWIRGVGLESDLDFERIRISNEIDEGDLRAGNF